MQTTGINLLRSVSGNQVEQTAMAAHVRVLGWISISLFLASGLASFVIFLFVQNFLSGAKAKESRLTQQLHGLVSVEGLHTVLKNRLSLLSRVLDAQDNYSQIWNLISKTSPDSGILEFTVDGQTDVVSVTYAPRTIAEANELIGELFRMSQEKRISSANLNSIVLGGDGKMSIAVSFFPI